MAASSPGSSAFYGSVGGLDTVNKETDTARLLDKPKQSRFWQGCPFVNHSRPWHRCVISTVLLCGMTIAAVFAGLLIARQALAKDPGGWFFLRDNPSVLGRKHSQSLLQGGGQQFDEDLAKALLVYAGAAYEARDDLSECLPELTVDLQTSVTVDGYDSNDIAGYTGVTSDFIVFAVEGSNTNSQLYQEWQDLGDTSFNGHSDILVVKYWNSVATQMYDDVVQSLSNLVADCPSCPVYFTGHSLGAATVTLILAMMYDNGDNSIFSEPPILVTFGQPRVGDYNFAELANNYFTSWRVVHYKDPVVHVPCCQFKVFSSDVLCYDKTSSGKFSPWHVSNEIYYGSDDMDGTSPTVCTGDPAGEDADCSNSVKWSSYSTDNHYLYYGVRVGYMCSYLTGALSSNDFFQSFQDSGQRETPYQKLQAMNYSWDDAQDWIDDGSSDYRSQLCI